MKGLSKRQLEMYEMITKRWKTVGYVSTNWAKALDILVNIHIDYILSDESRKEN